MTQPFNQNACTKGQPGVGVYPRNDCGEEKEERPAHPHMGDELMRGPMLRGVGTTGQGCEGRREREDLGGRGFLFCQWRRGTETAKVGEEGGGKKGVAYTAKRERTVLSIAAWRKLCLRILMRSLLHRTSDGSINRDQKKSARRSLLLSTQLVSLGPRVGTVCMHNSD